MSFYLFPIKHVNKMNGNTVQKSQNPLRTIISTVQISLGFNDSYSFKSGIPSDVFRDEGSFAK